MVDIKPILRAGVIAQSAALAAKNAKLLKKRKIKSKDFIESGVDSAVGISLLKVQSDILEGI
jgi:hypothetical protein